MKKKYKRICTELIEMVNLYISEEAKQIKQNIDCCNNKEKQDYLFENLNIETRNMLFYEIITSIFFFTKISMREVIDNKDIEIYFNKQIKHYFNRIKINFDYLNENAKCYLKIWNNSIKISSNPFEDMSMNALTVSMNISNNKVNPVKYTMLALKLSIFYKYINKYVKEISTKYALD